MKQWTEEDLLDLKEDIEKAKSLISELTGKKEYLMEQLESQWGCKTVAQAEKKSKKLEKELTELNEKIVEGIADLQEKYTQSE